MVTTTILDLMGVLFLVAFAWFVWPPAALLVIAAAFLLSSWLLSSAGGKS